MSITIVLEATRLKCSECEFLYTDDEPGEARARLETAYECECGNTFGKSHTDNGDNQCPECHRFAPKSDPDEFAICEECEEAALFEEVYVITCACHAEEHEIYV